MNQVSPTTTVVYARIAGAKMTASLSSMQRLTMRNGSISSLDLALYNL
jgi:hypothetical protein